MTPWMTSCLISLYSADKTHQSNTESGELPARALLESSMILRRLDGCSRLVKATGTGSHRHRSFTGADCFESSWSSEREIDAGTSWRYRRRACWRTCLKSETRRLFRQYARNVSRKATLLGTLFGTIAHRFCQISGSASGIQIAPDDIGALS